MLKAESTEKWPVWTRIIGNKQESCTIDLFVQMWAMSHSNSKPWFSKHVRFIMRTPSTRVYHKLLTFTLKEQFVIFRHICNKNTLLDTLTLQKPCIAFRGKRKNWAGVSGRGGAKSRAGKREVWNKATSHLNVTNCSFHATMRVSVLLKHMMFTLASDKLTGS